MFNEEIETMERWKGKTIWFLSKVYCNNCHQDSRFHQRCSIYSPVGYHAHRVGLSKNEMYNYIQYLKSPFEWDADFQNHSKPSNAFSYLNYNKYHFQRTLYEFHPSGRALPFHRYRRRLSEKKTSTSSRSQCSAWAIRSIPWTNRQGEVAQLGNRFE